jgi:type III secretion system YscD/HrpQ family protein
MNNAYLVAQEGSNAGLSLNLEEGAEWIIGRDPDLCDFFLEDSTVSRKHAILNRVDEGIVLKNLSRINPTLINGEEKNEDTLLKEGDRIQIGHTIFLFTLDPVPHALKPSKKSKKRKAGYDDLFSDLEAPKEEESPDTAAAPTETQDPKIPPAPPKPEVTAYDTIFEDLSEEEEEVPFHLISESPLLLKVISGPNAGAEIGLEKGRSYTLGKESQSNDIVFQDLSVSRNHARLNVNPDGILDIEDLGSKNGIVLNGHLITERTAITPQDLIALGTTVFMIIDREAPQETIYSPILSSYETSKAPEPVDNEEIAAQEEVQKEPKLSWKDKPIPTNYLVLAGSVAAVFLIMFISFFSLFKSKGLEVAQKEPTHEVKEALQKFPDVQFSYNPGSGKLFLVGHVLTPVDYQELKYRLSQINFITSIEDNVVIDEGVWKMMNDVISANPNWRSVSVHSPTAGKFIVAGYLPTSAELTTLSEYLTVNFPYLDRLQNQVVIEETLNAQLSSLIASQNLGGVTFQLTNGQVVVTGKYNETMTDSYKDLIREINKIQGVSSVKSFAVAVHPSQAGIDISDQYQVSGSSTFDGHGYSVVMNGKIYTLGDQVDGMKIKAIESSTILLEKDGLKYKIEYTH